jgi:hypothetical protein
MKEYPSIENTLRKGKVYAFDKLDGQNFRVEWSKKKKFYKFGSRKQMVGNIVDNEIYRWNEAIAIAKTKFEKDIHDIFVKNRIRKGVCIFEFHGPNSFAGRHADEPLDLTMIDVRVDNKGYLLPKDYLKMVGDLDIAKLLYYGNANSSFVDDVKHSRLEGMTGEGVVCKGQVYDRPGIPLMFKVKSDIWMSRLRAKCNGDEKLFEQLA